MSSAAKPAIKKTSGPDFKKYMDKKISVKINGNRLISGVLKGYDQFMNLVLDEAIEEVSVTEKNNIGQIIIRGNSVIQVEALEKI